MNPEEYLAFLSSLGLQADNDSFAIRYPARCLEELEKISNNTNAIVKGEGSDLVLYEYIENNFNYNFYTKIVVSPGFPFKMPSAFILEPDLAIGTPHRWQDNSLCLFDKSEFNSSMSILDIRNQTSAWIFAYEVWRATGEWPAAEKEH